jgi:D-glycerate 3-kinase
VTDLRAAMIRSASAGSVDGYCLDVADLAHEALDPNGGPRVVAISGPQGSGKSTLATALVSAFTSTGVDAIALSIDDFYLTRNEQVALATRYPGNRYLEHRGYPGTHDTALGNAVLDDLRHGRPTKLPRYDKSAFGGRGDRAPESSWTTVDRPPRLVFFEGWMLGFTPVDEELATGAMRAPNALLQSYAQWNVSDAFVLLEAAELSFIVSWRVDSERARRARGEPTLSDDEARDYIERFLPAYELYVPRLASAVTGPHARRFRLGVDRLPDRT